VEASGSFTAQNNPGSALIAKAKRLAELPEFQFEGAAEAHFAWDRDLILIFGADATTLRELPLKETFAYYEDKLK
jgi:hypothetical protein